MSSKPFDPELYDADDNAKQIVITWLVQLGYQARVNPDQYGIDVLATRGERQIGFEVEVKHAWKGDRFPFATVHIAGRKRKFAQPGNHFLMLNDERTKLLSITASSIQTAPTVVKDTIYTQSEGFIEIPRSQCRFFDLGEQP